MVSSSRNKKGGGPRETNMERGTTLLWDIESPMADAEVFAPPMDLYEKEDSVVVEIELPGVKKEQIEIYVSRSQVIVEGPKRDQDLDSGQAPRDEAESARGREGTSPGAGRFSYLRIERKFGRFKREIELPMPCNTRDGEAEYKEGVLKIEFKKIKDRRGQRHRIPVK